MTFRHRRLFRLLFLLALGCSTTAVEPRFVTRSRYLMGTVCEISVEKAPGAAASIEAAFSEIARIEALISTWRSDTELARLNASAVGEPVPVSPEITALLSEALRWSAATGGAFNPLVGHLTALWDLRGAGRVPDGPQRERGTELARATDFLVDPAAHQVTRAADVDVEEGGFGKGYALDRAGGVLRSRRVRRAVINFGGQVLLYGFDDAPHQVRIAHPEKRDQAIATVDIPSGSVSSSSGSERSFSGDGTVYSHILDPRTGTALPPGGQVTVIHPSAFVADICSTALYVLGPEAGLRWAEANGIAAVFVTPSGSIEASSWLRRATTGFRATDPAFHVKG